MKVSTLRKSLGGVICMLILTLAVWIVIQGCGSRSGKVEPPDVEPPVQDTCGFKVRFSPSDSADTEGYNIHYGQTSGQYSNIYTTSDTFAVIKTDTGGVWFIAVTAFDEVDNESDFSEEVSIKLDSCITDSLPEPPDCDIPFGETRVADLDYDNFEPEREHLKLKDNEFTGEISGTLCVDGIYKFNLEVKHDVDASDKFTVLVEDRHVGTIMTPTTNNEWAIYEVGKMKVEKGETVTIQAERGGPGSFCRTWNVELR